MTSALMPVYPRLPIELVRAEGSYLFLADGRRIVDLYGGHAVSPLGHGHPELAEALLSAFRTVDFYSNSLHMSVQERAARAVLGDVAGGEASAHLTRVHFVNSGAEANESALHVARRLTGRRKVLSFDIGFHGRTLGSLAATHLDHYAELLPLPMGDFYAPIRFGSFEDLAKIDDTVAAVLCESIPSLGGLLNPPDGYYAALQARCRDAGAMFVMDEVQGGIGRTGTWFAHQGFGVAPDMVTLAKSLGGGFPVAAMVSTEAIASRLKGGDLGTTFGGGPMACAMVETVARIVHRDGLMARNVAMFDHLAALLADVPGVTLRGKGALIGVQGPLPGGKVRDALLAKGFMVGTCGEPHTLRLLLPYVLPMHELDAFAAAYREVVHG